MRARLGGVFDSPAVIALGRFAAMGLALLATPIIARVLGPEGRGVTAAVMAVLAVLPVAAGLGVPLAVRRRVAAGDGTVGGAVRAGRRFAVFTTIPVVVVAAALYVALFRDVGVPATVAYWAAVATLPGVVSWSVDANTLLAGGQYRRMAALSVTQSAMSTGVVLAAWVSGTLSVAAVIVGVAAGNVAAFTLGRWWVRTPPGRPERTGDLTREGATMVGGVLADVSARRVDQMIALPLLGASGAGLYSVAATVGTLVAPVVQAVGNAAFKDLTKAGRSETATAVRHGVALAVMAAVAVSAAGWVGIPVIFGDAFTPARTVAVIVAAGAVPSSAGFVAAMALAAQGHGSSMSAAQVTAAVVGLSLTVPFGYVWGPAGVAAAVAVGSTVGLGVSLRALRLNPFRIVPRPGDFPAAVAAMFRPGPRHGPSTPPAVAPGPA